MKLTVKTTIGLLLLCAIVTATGAIVHRHSHSQRIAPTSNSKDLIPWRTDLDAATKEAALSHKPLLIEFMATWCPDCAAMHDQTWSNPGIAAALQSYIPVQIDSDAHPDQAKKYSVESIPAIFVVDPTTGKIQKETRGVPLSPTDFLNWLK